VITYGLSEQADVVVSEVVTGASGVSFTVSAGGGAPHGLAGLGRREVTVGSLVGAHMALNAAAALTMAVELGLDPDTVIGAWRNFGGVHRRFELHGQAGGVRVYDDYAHHPTEVEAQLRAARDVAAPGRLIGVFQPGTFSRTQTFAAEFGQAMAVADVAVVLDIFPAREEPIPGVTGATIVERVPLPDAQVVYEPDFDAAAGHIAALARPGDLVLTMGIGNVYQLCPRILAVLAGEPPGRP
jgi:UDP-N-acetylmuramate--alanine ligase